MVLSNDNVLYIKHKYDQPKLGIKCKTGLVLGFVFINLKSTISKLRTVVYTEIVVLDKLQESFIFLDSNGWPIRRDQEELITVLEVVKDCCVTLCPNLLYMESLLSNDIELASLTSDTLDTPPRKKSKQLHELTFGINKDVNRSSCSHEESFSIQSKQILISYVRAEAADHALRLKHELSVLGFSVYLDVHEIKSGVDWQDSLNYAVSNCQIFLPLITPRYGATQWTNREVKLADVLGKYILPINFLETWPPRCLAIQFATTQYIEWKTPAQILTDIAQFGENKARDIRFWDKHYISMVSESIANRLKQIVDVDLERLPSLTRRKTLMKTFVGKLPNGILAQVSDDSSSNGSNTTNVVICVHPAQKTFSCFIKDWLMNQGYEVWCSNERDISMECSDTLPSSQDSVLSEHGFTVLDNEYIRYFQEKADQADVVIIILSKGFTTSRTCQQQVYYCEQRKPVIPLQYEDVCLPGWLSMLIGSSRFQDVHQEGYKDLLLSQIQRCVDPTGKDNIQIEINQAKITTAINHIQKVIRNPSCVYISGSTKFYNNNSEEICRSIGAHLATLDKITLVTGGFYGVGETVSKAFYEENQKLWKKHKVWHILPEKDDQDKSLQARQGKDGRFQIVPFGKSLFCGESVHEREILVAKAFDICILIEGGPGAAHEVEEFVWNDHLVIPIVCTGGAAGGKFNVPDKIFQVPNGVSEDDWSILSSKDSSANSIGKSVSNIVKVLLTGLINQGAEVKYSPQNACESPQDHITTSAHKSPNTMSSLTKMNTVLLS